MKIVIYYNNGMEAKTLTPEQLDLIRRSVACLYEEEKEWADMAAPLSGPTEIKEEANRIEAIEELQTILRRQEVYEKAKEA
jgi:hypothetical protein